MRDYAGGAAYCLGDNGEGQRGTTASASLLTPTLVEGGHAFASLASGRAHSCGLTSSGEAWCWGRGTEGQLGDGSFLSHTVPAPIPGVSFSSISAGGYSTCGITTAGLALCWGANDRGQVGDGTTTPRAAPTTVSGGPTNYVSLKAGYYGACAVTDHYEAYCWGYGIYGRLGDGTTATSTVPVRVLNH